MNVRRSFLPTIFLTLMSVALLLPGMPNSGFAYEPHICINNAISTFNQSLGGVSSFTFTYKANCGSHGSNTILMKIKVYKNQYPYSQLSCTGSDGQPNGNPVPPDSYSVTCPVVAGTRYKTVIEYQVVGSTWMSHTDYFTN